jgi:hypothetical protein
MQYNNYLREHVKKVHFILDWSRMI